MKNYWLERKAIAEEIKNFKIPEIPPIDFPAIDLTKIPPPDINLPPIVFGPCIDITGMTFDIPTEIKLTAIDIPSIIRIDGMPVSPSVTPDFSCGLPPSPIMVDWGMPPEISCIVTIVCPTIDPNRSVQQ